VSLTPQVGLAKAVTTLTEGYKEAAFAGLGLWLPAMSVIYTFVPAHLRLQSSYYNTLNPNPKPNPKPKPKPNPDPNPNPDPARGSLQAGDELRTRHSVGEHHVLP